jgi:hypothetical protein
MQYWANAQKAHHFWMKVWFLWGERSEDCWIPCRPFQIEAVALRSALCCTWLDSDWRCHLHCSRVDFGYTNLNLMISTSTEVAFFFGTLDLQDPFFFSLQTARTSNVFLTQRTWPSAHLCPFFGIPALQLCLAILAMPGITFSFLRTITSSPWKQDTHGTRQNS